MSDYEVKIERGLILYLREERGITAIDASLGESEFERGRDGCDTCGYDGSDGTITTPIYYKGDGGRYDTGTVEIHGTSINFLPTLLEYIDRAN
ncbi:MAG TPA: hypothetical protein VIY48_09175 [Candidatus Paceibacterota bacterium]